MKYLITILLVAVSFSDLDKIARVNKIKKEAKEAFNSGDYEIAAKKYSFLLDSMDVDDDNIKLNLANAYYQLRDTTGAMTNYNDLLESNNNIVRSVANQQLGVMANRDKKFEEALDHFKQALKSNPNNEDARYNYELLKKILEEQEEQDKKDQDQNQDQKQDKDQENKDQEQEQNDQSKPGENEENKEDQQEKDKEGDQENKDQEKEGEGKDEKEKESEKEKQEKEAEEKKKEEEGKEGEESKEDKAKEDQMNSLSDKLKEMNISPEKAKMILEAMRNNEIQYLQQNKRKPTKRKDPGKPDW